MISEDSAKANSQSINSGPVAGRIAVAAPKMSPGSSVVHPVEVFADVVVVVGVGFDGLVALFITGGLSTPPSALSGALVGVGLASLVPPVCTGSFISTSLLFPVTF